MATYYIDPTGVDDAGRNGLTTGTAWATLSYACTRATTAGDIIFVNAGTYTETAQSLLSVGVSIMGVGATSIIKAGDIFRPLIKLASALEGTNGNQSISYIKFEGDNLTNSIIEIYARSNVSIHNCEFYNSVKEGVLFYSKVDRGEGLIITYSENNKFYNNYVYNCSHFGAYPAEWNTHHYGVGIGGQKNMLIYGNTIIQPDKGMDAEGVCIGFTGWGQNCGTKIYNNILETTPKKGGSSATYGWGFAIELWTQRGGVEVYNNDIKGAIDFGGYDSNDDEGYGYAIKIYGNRIGFSSVSQYTSWGILLENGIQGGVYIYRNIIENSSIAITLHVLETALIKTIENINVYYNIFKNIRKDGAVPPYGYGMQIYSSEVSPFTNLNIYNNIFYTDAIGYFYSILQCNDTVTSFSNINFKNNIGIYINQPIRITTGTINSINIENNDMFNCSATLWNFTGCVVTNDVIQNNITSDPLFIGGSPYDYRLQSSSPAINAGIDVGLTSDFIETLVPYGSAPDIGAYEWFEVEYDFTNITLVNTPACYNAVDNTIISRWVATECPINFTLLRRDWYVINSSDVGGFLAVNIYGSFTGNNGDVISVYDATTNSIYTGTITDSSGDPVLITDIPYVSGMDIKYLNDHTLYAGYYFEGRLTINGVVESLTVIASPDSFGYADLDVSGILRIKTSIGKVTNYLSLIQKDTNKSGQFTLEYRGCWYGSNEAWISEGSITSPAADVVWYYAECVRSEEQGCNLAEYVPNDLNDAPFLNQFDTPVYWYGLPFDLSFILPERTELSPTSDIIVTMKVYNSANTQIGADITQTIDVDSLEGYVNSLNIDSTLISAGAAYFTVEITAM